MSLGVLPFLVILLAIPATTVLAQVPSDKTFKIVNEGEFGERITEYGAYYRVIRNDNYTFYSYPFRLCFYNTTPDAFVFAVRAGRADDDNIMRWVWDANRNNPVGENAVLSFGRDGNLVLAESDGRVKWQTSTANKGVTGIRMLPNGNLVLHDKKGRFVWQSFDHPVDTLLTGQSLRLGGPTRLVSRTSDEDGSDGPYSMVLERKGFTMYVNKTGQPLIYGGWPNSDFHGSVTFEVVPENDKNTAYELILRRGEPPATPPSSAGNHRRLLQVRPIGGGSTYNLNKANYNATISFLRLGSDGNLRAFSYYDGATYLQWEETFAFFSTYFIRRCGLPSFCGDYGLCDKGMCVACPTPKGLAGWSESCEPPKTTQFCRNKGKKVNYYKIVGVEHFLGPYLDGGEGPIKVSDCKAKCDRDCKCLGFFYKEDTSKCLLAPLLATLIKDVNTTSVGYIKY